MPSQASQRKAASTLRGIALLLFILVTTFLPTAAAAEIFGPYPILGEMDGFAVIKDDGPIAIAGEEIRMIAVQPWDGKVLVGGSFTISEMGTVVEVDDEDWTIWTESRVVLSTRKNLARFNNDGSLDTTFAPEPDGPVHAVVIEQDMSDPTKPGQSRIYIGGAFTTIAGATRNGLARIGADGALDPVFAPATAAGTVINAMLLQGNQRIVLGGSFGELDGAAALDGSACRNLAALSIAAGSDGDLVHTFSGGTDGVVNALMMQEGYLVAGGGFTSPRRFLARFLPGDQLDGTFSAEPGGAVRALALQPDGMILVGGDFTSITTSLAPLSAQPRQYLARLTANGKLDPFDAALEPFEAAGENYVAALAMQPDGKILAAGRFTRSTGDPVKPKQHHFARYKQNGAFDNGIDTGTDQAISVITLEPNGRFLIGGRFTSVVTSLGTRSRLKVARFYFHGGLDDDGALFPPSRLGVVKTVGVGPDGSVIIGGVLPSAPPTTAYSILKLNPDLGLDPSFAAEVVQNHATSSLAFRPDGKLVVAGWFTQPRTLYLEVAQNGTLTPFSTYLDKGPPLERGLSWGALMLLLPKVSRTTKPVVGTMDSDGMMYLGITKVPLGGRNAEAVFSLVRIQANGEIDPNFNAPELDNMILTGSLQEDGKILIGGMFTGQIMRLHTNGEIDTEFRPWHAVGAQIWTSGIVVQRDGKIVINGNFRELVSPDDPLVKVPRIAIARLNSDGSLDDEFVVKPNYHMGIGVHGVTMLSDGGMLLHGVFSEVDDGTGTYPRSSTARLSREAKIVGPDLLAFPPMDMAWDTIGSVALQPDGKVLIGGTFNGDWDITPLNRRDAKFLTRVATPMWATEELVVAPDGSAITWRRGGGGPGLWQVWFEEKSDEPDAQWSYLGRAESVEGTPDDWSLSLPRSGARSLPVKQNRYVRARGYVQTSGMNNGYSMLVESVRQYYLKEPVRVRAQAESRVYGQPIPASYTATYLDAAGEPKVMEPGTFLGWPTFRTTATSGSGAGSYPIIADLSGMTSLVYALIPENGTLSVTKATLTVTAEDTTSPPGVANRSFTAGYSGFVGSDTRENSVQGEPGFTTTADASSPPGSYDIFVSEGTLRSANYQFSYRKGTLTIEGRRRQSITFDPLGEKTYGEGGFPVVARAESGLPISYTSSDPRVAVVENGVLKPGRAGSTLITATQGGNQWWEPATAVSQPFVVKKKELKVAADAKARSYLTPNPTLTANYLGFVNGENREVVSGTPQFATDASLYSPVRDYTITVGVANLRADNYFFTPVNGTLTVWQSCQQIIFPPLGERTYGDPPVPITAASCSGLTLGFMSDNPLVATVTGDLLTITGAGSVRITASQGGNGDLKQAPDVSQTLVVHKRGQVITFAPLPQKVLGDLPLALQGSASSDLSLAYSSSDPAVATVSGSTLTITGAGTTVVTARQEGDGNYEAALPASQPFTVALEEGLPALTLSTLSSGSTTASPVVNVSGSAADDSGITSLTVNRADLTGSAALFSSAVPLAVGMNNITVTAKDAAGNVASETLSVTLDATAPPLSVADPADNSVTDAALFTATGTVPAGSRVTMAVNGAAPQAVAVTSETFNGTGYLHSGINTIELTAELSGRSARAKRTVTLAEGAPPVAITDPGEDLRTEADSILIKGRVGTGNPVGVLLEVNGVSLNPAVEGGVFQQQVALQQAGEYRLKVTVSDGAGHSSSATRNIIKVDRIAGDLDSDGRVDIGDALALLRISLGIDPATEQAVAHGDLAPVINGVSQPDGRIGVGDVLILLRKIVGLTE